jgi:hypothetical protein
MAYYDLRLTVVRLPRIQSFHILYGFFLLTADGVAYTFGLFFVVLTGELHASKSATSWIASIMAGVTYASGKRKFRFLSCLVIFLGVE